MRRLLLATVLLLSTTCAPPEFVYPYDLDSELVPYVREFYRDFPDSQRIPIRFEPTIPIYTGDIFRPVMDAAGLCLPHPLFPAVVINEAARGNDNDLRFLVYHELGHCVLGLSHAYDPIMWPIVSPINVTPEYWDLSLEMLRNRYEKGHGLLPSPRWD